VSYDPATARYLCFAQAREDFVARRDDPRAYLERCLETLHAREPQVQAFVSLDEQSARGAADASVARYRAHAPLSLVDGLPIAIKDCYETADFPTEVNSALFRHWRPDRDAAHVYALRSGGAIVLGKTVTTELTMAGPGPTRNPWDLSRTPGGSSSGSAAAVAAAMLPAATGSQVRGSVLRPASICGVIGFKPTYGAVNRLGGFDPSPSLNHFGILAGTLIDAWQVTQHIAATVGGDPGYPGLYGEASLPAAARPVTLARQYTHGWSLTDAASREAFEKFLAGLQAKGIEVLEPRASPELEACEDATRRTPEFFFDLMLWEMAWPMLEYRRRRPESLSATVHGYLDRIQAMTLTDYRRALERRDELRRLHRALRGKVDAFITLAHIGPGQKGLPAVGTPWYNDPSSAIGAPTLNLPVLQVEGVPLGVQLMGYEHEDYALVAMARALLAG
jgi:Asp-tRNA(Asn)/Glu-tRNA(Gln) amidotransferase A subunit family amidase